MACIEVETPARTEARLRKAFNSARVGLLEGSWSWEIIAGDAFPAGIRSEAVALARNSDGWSQLVPAAGSASGSWALVSVQFGAGSDSDGFSEWFAAYLRRRLGTRVMMTTGLHDHSGVYGYWGVPSSLRGQLIREIGILATAPATGVRAVGLL